MQQRPINNGAENWGMGRMPHFAPKSGNFETVIWQREDMTANKSSYFDLKIKFSKVTPR